MYINPQLMHYLLCLLETAVPSSFRFKDVSVMNRRLRGSKAALRDGQTFYWFEYVHWI